MTQKAETIEHPGMITRIVNDAIEVMILSSSACSSCSAKGACNMSEMEEKIVKVRKPHNDHLYKTGQQVIVYMDGRMGFKAVFLGYVLPFLLVLTVLIVVLSLGMGEGVAGLLALVVLVPYYLLVYTFRDRLDKRFQFYIR